MSQVDQLIDDFTDGDYTSAPVWNETGGTSPWTIVSNKLRRTQGGTNTFLTTLLDTTYYNATQLSLQCTVLFNGMTSANDFLDFYAYNNNQTSTPSHPSFKVTLNPQNDTVNIIATDGVDTVNVGGSFTFTLGVEYDIKAVRNGTTFTVYVNGSSVVSGSNVDIADLAGNKYIGYQGSLATASSYIAIDDISFKEIYPTTSFAVSPIIDTVNSINGVFGLLVTSSSTPENTNIEYEIRTSTDSNMGDSPSYTAVLSGAKPSNTFKQYVQIKSSFTSSAVLNTSQLNDITLDWATTGYYITPEFVIAAINSWGVFEVDETLNDGTMTYFTYSSNTIVSDGDLKDVVTWTSQTKNAIIVVATNTYVWAKAVYSITVATQVPAVNAVTLNWVSGSDTSEDMTAFWDGERLYLGVMQTNTSSTNDGVFVWDPELKAWWPYKTGVFPSVLTFWNNTFLVASSTAGVVYSFLEGETDNGADIDAYYRTKYLTATGGLSPFVTSLQYLGVVYDRQTSGNLLMDTYLNGNATAVDTYTFDQTGGDDIHFDLFKIPHSSNCRYFQFRIYNSAGSAFTLHSIFGETKTFPIRFGVQE